MNRKFLLILIVLLASLLAVTVTYAQDGDGDGFDASIDDCNDADPNMNPNAPDPEGDGIDQNCDGQDGVISDEPDTDGDNIFDDVDQCINQPGPPEFNGCPDSDGDGIPDNQDVCPDAGGPPSAGGCPDADGDGTPDNIDACPQPGPPEFLGCPDSDGDGIPDNNDQCPNEAGTLSGCPDNDGDGVPNHLDNCPNLAGLAHLMGCPDRDGDNVHDLDDRCPDTPGLVQGPAEIRGCPDADGDQVIDSNDLCPNRPGPAETNGCGDPDNDGILDNEDECPDFAGTLEFRGCAFFDSDLDGVNDEFDHCPEESGPGTNFGCPDTVTLVVLNKDTGEQVLASDLLTFEVDLGIGAVTNAEVVGELLDLERYECWYYFTVIILVTEGDVLSTQGDIPITVKVRADLDGQPFEVAMQEQEFYEFSGGANPEGDATLGGRVQVPCWADNPEEADVNVLEVSVHRGEVLLNDEYDVRGTSEVWYRVYDITEVCTLCEYAMTTGAYPNLTIEGMTEEEFLASLEEEPNCNKGNALHGC